MYSQCRQRTIIPSGYPRQSGQPKHPPAADVNNSVTDQNHCQNNYKYNTRLKLLSGNIVEHRRSKQLRSEIYTDVNFSFHDANWRDILFWSTDGLHKSYRDLQATRTRVQGPVGSVDFVVRSETSESRIEFRSVPGSLFRGVRVSLWSQWRSDTEWQHNRPGLPRRKWNYKLQWTRFLFFNCINLGSRFNEYLYISAWHHSR